MEMFKKEIIYVLIIGIPESSARVTPGTVCYFYNIKCGSVTLIQETNETPSLYYYLVDLIQIYSNYTFVHLVILIFTAIVFLSYHVEYSYRYRNLKFFHSSLLLCFFWVRLGLLRALLQNLKMISHLFINHMKTFSDLVVFLSNSLRPAR